MKMRHILSASLPAILVSVVIVSWPARTYTSGATKETNQQITELRWLAGRWQTAPGGRAQIEEHWTEPAGGSMFGIGRTVAGNKTVEFEFLRIEQRADGVYYVATINNKCPGTDFKLTRLTGEEAVFENPQHDFPKRVIYRKNSNGSLSAKVDAGEGTKSQSFEYRPLAK